MSKTTILMYSRTRGGKTTLLGELAEHVLRTTGKISRIYTGDRGGVGPLMPYIDLGIIELVEQGDTLPWIFWNQAVRGKVRDGAGGWKAGDNDQIGMFAFESATSFADAIMADMAKKAADGINIGGGSNVAFNVEGDGIRLKISGSNMAHYGVAQSRITEEIWESQKLPCSYLVWTASISKDEDPASGSGNKVLGPAIAGKALTAEVPRWFNLTFRLDALPAENGRPERHLLYLGNHRDAAAGNAIGLGNTRTALDAPEIKQTIIEPASIVKALQLIESGSVIAREAVAKRLGKELLDKVKALKVANTGV